MERNADKNELYERYGLICSSFGSVLIHCIAFAVLMYSTNIYPVIAMPSTKEVLWFYPSLFFGSSTVSNETADNDVPLQQKTIALLPAFQNIPGRPEPVVEEDTTPDISPVRHADISAESTPLPPVAEKAAQEFSVITTPVSPPSKIPAKPEKPEHEVRKAAVAFSRPPVAHRQRQKEAENPVVVGQRPVEMPSVATPFVADTNQKGDHPLSKASDLRQVAGIGRKPDGSGLNEPVMQRGEKETPSSAVSAMKKDDAAQARSGTISLKKVANSFPVSGESQKHAAAPVIAKDPVQAIKSVKGEVSDKKVSSASGKEKGLFSPPLTGDIKFELVAREDLDRGVKVVVSFRDFPKARRGRPLSRAEAMRVRPMAPKIVMPKGNAIHAIIDHAAEGVYYMRVELERQQVSDASITIRLFEGSSRARNKTVHIRTISNNEIVIRLMMPEGVIWEDASAFSGSLEDSDSVTKFNPETGLEWKEYN